MMLWNKHSGSYTGTLAELKKRYLVLSDEDKQKAWIIPVYEDGEIDPFDTYARLPITQAREDKADYSRSCPRPYTDEFFGLNMSVEDVQKTHFESVNRIEAKNWLKQHNFFAWKEFLKKVKKCIFRLPKSKVKIIYEGENSSWKDCKP